MFVQRIPLLAGALLIGTLFLGSCSEDESPTPAAEPAVESIPYPELDTFEPLVQQQLAKARAQLEAVLADPATSQAARGATFGETGMLYNAYDLRDAAIAAYQNAVVLDTAEFRWPYFLGALLLKEGRTEESAEHLLEALERNPDHGAIRIYLARLRRETGDLEEARALVDTVLATSPENALALAEKGRQLLASKSFAEAVELFQRVKGLYPDATALDYELGRAYRGLGENERALELMQRDSVRRNLSDPLLGTINALRMGSRAHLSAGNVAFGSGDYERAAREYREAVRVSPDQPMTRMNLGAALVKLGRLDEAVVELRAATRLGPENAKCHFNLGTVLASLGQEDAALLHLREAVRLDPESRDARMNLANALRRNAQVEEALPHYRKIVDREPDREDARLGEIFCLVALERFDEAVERADLALRVLPEKLLIRHTAARLLAAVPVDELRDGERALELAEGLLELHPEQAEFQETMAMALAETGSFDRAIVFQSQAFEKAQRAERPVLARFMRQMLERYVAREPCRTPFDPEGHDLAPPRRQPVPK